MRNREMPLAGGNPPNVEPDKERLVKIPYIIFNPFSYKNGKDFLEKTKMTVDEALEFLDFELEKRKVDPNDI